MSSRIKFFTFLLAVFLVNHSYAYREMPKVDSLSKDSYIALLTCDPGEPLYATFGHSAIGVVDPVNNLMLVFNYGTFSFNVPFFYAKFASGKLLYSLSINTYQHFLREYQYEKRKVIEVKLDLTQNQKQQLFDLLKENYKPENREYQYDFFFDNCATRITDILHVALGDSLLYNAPPDLPVKTFRNLIDEYLTKSYWSDFGIDLALGSVIDKPASATQSTFLPDYLNSYLKNCTLNGKPLVSKTRFLVPNTDNFRATRWWIRPVFVFWLIFGAVVLAWIFTRNKSWIIADRIIFGFFGFVGIIILLLWVATDHDATAGNWNVIWLNPLYLGFASLIGSKHRMVIKWGALGFAILNLLVLLGWSILPQQFHIAFLPIISLLLFRSIVIFVRNQ